MYCAAIAGDIIASTSLSDEGREVVQAELSRLFTRLRKDYAVYGRNTQGDYIVSVVPDPKLALRIALCIKCCVKSTPLHEAFVIEPTPRTEKFVTYGARLAIAIGELHRYDPEKGIIDGDAIYRAGRKINQYSTYGKKRIVIKDSLYLVSHDMTPFRQFEPMLALADELLVKATPRQSQVLLMKLLKMSEDEISRRIKISQPVVNKHSNSAGWNAIRKSVDYFEAEVSRDPVSRDPVS